MDIIKPKKLEKGDTIGIISPASRPKDLTRIDGAINYLEGLGYKIKLGKNAKNLYGFLAGTDEERLSDLHEMFLDKDVKAIICTRGGYGTPRLIDKIDYSIIKNNPKIFVGYSDITALQLAFFEKAGLVTFSGPMAAVEMYEKIDPFTEECFWAMVTSVKNFGVLKNPDGEPFKTFNKGNANGILMGGNLSLIVTLFGTSYCPSFKDSILYFEEIDEEPYSVDRYLSILRNGKIFEQIKGLIVGSMTDCAEGKTQPTLSLEQVFLDYLKDIKIPIIDNLIYGQKKKKNTMPFGIKAKIDTETKEIEILEGAVV
jgi:muramoyltetrapeptide carboxypeptidase